MQKKNIDLCGLGNGLVDILAPIDQKRFEVLQFEKASMRLVEPAEQQALISNLSDIEMRLVSGGSVANSVVAFAQLGGKASYLSSLGDDRFGLHFRSELGSFGIELSQGLKHEQPTGTSLVLITPDAERTMRVCLGAAATLSAADVDEEIIARSKWLFIEGYVFANPGSGLAAIKQAVSYARKYNTKIALTISEAWVVQNFGEALHEIAKQSDLIFANASEACALSAKDTAEEAFESMAANFPGAVVTLGQEGALLCWQGEKIRVQAFPCEPLDLTGAGDMFAAVVLYGLNNSVALKDTGRAACYLAMQVITRRGARLTSGVTQYWDEALGMR